MIKLEKKTILGIGILLLCFVLSLIFFLVFNTKQRYVLYFQHRDTGKNQVEARYLPKLEKEKRIGLLVDELLLGPVSDRSLPLFPRNTKSLNTVLIEKTLYVNLSSEAFHINQASSVNKTGAELFRNNIFRNFKNIDTIQIYIDGSLIYENEAF